MDDKWFVDGCNTPKENNEIKTDIEILNWYRNLYHKEEQDTERGIMARAINGIFMQMKEMGIDLNKFDKKYKAPFDL
jgi:hypothetical protein